MKFKSLKPVGKMAAVAVVAAFAFGTVGVSSAKAWWEVLSFNPPIFLWVPDPYGPIMYKPSGGSWGDDGGCTSQSCLAGLLAFRQSQTCLQGGATIVRASRKFFCTTAVNRLPALTEVRGPPPPPIFDSVALGRCIGSMTRGVALKAGRYTCVDAPGMRTTTRRPALVRPS